MGGGGGVNRGVNRGGGGGLLVSVCVYLLCYVLWDMETRRYGAGD